MVISAVTSISVNLKLISLNDINNYTIPLSIYQLNIGNTYKSSLAIAGDRPFVVAGVLYLAVVVHATIVACLLASWQGTHQCFTREAETIMHNNLGVLCGQTSSPTTHMNNKETTCNVYRASVY